MIGHKIKILFAVTIMILPRILFSQDLYDVEHITEIKIYFTQENWDDLLDANFIAGEEERILCSVEIDGTLLESVGIRYKGFSSASVDYVKNPFNIKLNYVVQGQSYQGIDKLKLSNVIQDPSFVREVLSYEIGRKYMPASKANFAKVYINDIYWGLYTSVETVANEFLGDHFNTTNNPFFKCNPNTLDLFGENSNLSNSPGNSEADYYELYDMKSDAGWSEFLGMINVLNDDPDNIESVLNVDRALWMHAYNYALVNFDSYIGYAQNYYLYEDQNGQFNPILWDLNMSFGSYRLSDASEFWDGFGIEEAKTIDPLLHFSSVSVFPRPLMRNLFENDIYRRQYLAHLRTIIEENFANGEYMERAQFFHDLIDIHVENDENKFYSYQDFLDNLTMTVTDLVEYPGISDLMDARTEYLLQYDGIPSQIEYIDSSWPNTLNLGGEFLITAEVTNASDMTLAYRYGGTGLFTKVDMPDDGVGADLQAGDGIYSYELQNTGNAIQFYFYSDNGESGRFNPERAAYEFFSVESQIASGEFVINEFMALNVAAVVDEDNDFDDWIEFYNNTEHPISTAGLYLSDDELNPVKWEMPNATVEPNDFLIVWADEEGSEGSLHANFQLAFMGEFISLAYADSTIIDSVVFDEVGEDQSIARFPNGTGPFIEMNSTFDDFNLMVSVDEESLATFRIYPNPAREEVMIEREFNDIALLELRNIDGHLLHQKTLYNNTEKMDLSELSSGIYILQLYEGLAVSTQKLIIQ